MSPALVAFGRESFRHCPAARLPIAAAARCRPEFPPSTVARCRVDPANPHHARRSQECGSSAALPLGACGARGRYHIEKRRWHRRFSQVHRRHPCCGANRFRTATPAHKFPKCDASQVLTACRRAAYIGLSRCAVRLGVTARLRSSFTDTRFLRGPGVRFRSEARNFGLSRLGESGALWSRAV
jgi:hypothetical protein